MSTKSLLFISLMLVGIGVAGRLLPHAWNFTPITAIALFATTYLGIRYSLVIVVFTMAISDFFIGTYNWRIMLVVYLSFAVAGTIGFLLRRRIAPLTVLAAALGSSSIFFILTNWAVWQFGTMYPHSASGLLQSYTLALPFFRNALLGDLVYAGILFGAYALAARLSLLPKTQDRNVPRPLSPESHG